MSQDRNDARGASDPGSAPGKKRCEPGVAQGAVMSGGNVRSLITVLSHRRITELDAPLPGGDGDTRYIDLVPVQEEGPHRKLFREELRRLVGRALRHLDPRTRRIIVLRFGLAGGQPMTLEQIGQMLQPELSRERIRQIEAQALDKLREALEPVLEGGWEGW